MVEMKSFFYVATSIYLMMFLTILYIYKTDGHLKWATKLSKIDKLEQEVAELRKEIKLLKP